MLKLDGEVGYRVGKYAVGMQRLMVRKFSMILKKLLLLIEGVLLSSARITACSLLVLCAVTGNDMEAFLLVPRLMQGTTANVVRRM